MRVPRSASTRRSSGRGWRRDTGVDALFVEAPESVAELEAIAAALPDITLVANMVETGRTPLLTPTELAELGFRLIVSPLTALFTMVQAVQRLARRSCASTGILRDHLDRLVDFDEFTELVDLAGHSREHDYRADRCVI